MAIEYTGSIEFSDRKFESVRIGLISDTHIPRDAKALPPHVAEAFKGVDLILHAGDIYLSGTLDELENIAPVRAARGNGDWWSSEDERVNENHILDETGLNLGLTHAINYPASLEFPFEKVMEREFGRSMDVIVFGDTHVAMVTRHDGTLLVNPGSPTLPSGRFQLGTVGILEVMKNEVRARIIQLSDFAIPFDRDLIYYAGY